MVPLWQIIFFCYTVCICRVSVYMYVCLRGKDDVTEWNGCGCLGEVGGFPLSVAFYFYAALSSVAFLPYIQNSSERKVDLIRLDSDILLLELRATPQTLQLQTKKKLTVIHPSGCVRVHLRYVSQGELQRRRRRRVWACTMRRLVRSCSLFFPAISFSPLERRFWHACTRHHSHLTPPFASPSSNTPPPTPCITADT